MSMKYKPLCEKIIHFISVLSKGYLNHKLECITGCASNSVKFYFIYIAPKQYNCVKALYRAQSLHPLPAATEIRDCLFSSRH